MKKKNEIDEKLKEGWVYATLFSTKFHSKQQTSDTVRRRRWHRAMQPIPMISGEASAIFRFEERVTISPKNDI